MFVPVPVVLQTKMSSSAPDRPLVLKLPLVEGYLPTVMEVPLLLSPSGSWLAVAS